MYRMQLVKQEVESPSLLRTVANHEAASEGVGGSSQSSAGAADSAATSEITAATGVKVEEEALGEEVGTAEAAAAGGAGSSR